MAKVLKKKVKLTKHDITCAIAREASLCPVAKALNRQHKQKGWKVFEADEIRSPYSKRYTVISKDFVKVDKFIHDFDAGRKVKPITFDIVTDTDVEKDL